MSKFVKIPSYRNPYEVIINGVKYQYQAGQTCMVPDSVAMVIRNVENLAPKHAKETVGRPDIVETVSGEVISVSDSAEAPLQGLRVFGKTIQNGTPTPAAPVALESVGSGGSVAVSIGAFQGDPNAKTISISTPNGLPGIPVSSGGNYTDASGQQWICDEIDLENGMYVQRILRIVPNKVKGGGVRDGETAFGSIVTDRQIVVGSSVLATHLPQSNSYIASSNQTVGVYAYNEGELRFRISGANTINEITEFIANNSVEFLCALANAEYHNLTAEELTSYATMHTNYPNTMMYNDAGAGMEVKYVADTKLYVDKKFNVLAAMVNNA